MKTKTKKLLSEMIAYIDLYLNSKTELLKLVDDLETGQGILREELDDSAYTQWFEYWADLEIDLADLGSKRDGHYYEHIYKRTVKNSTLLKEHIQSLLDDTLTRG